MALPDSKNANVAVSKDPDPERIKRRQALKRMAQAGASVLGSLALAGCDLIPTVPYSDTYSNYTKYYVYYAYSKYSAYYAYSRYSRYYVYYVYSRYYVYYVYYVVYYNYYDVYYVTLWRMKKSLKQGGR